MINERKLSKSELNKREDIIMKMKGNKRDLVKKYGKDAEAVMYGRATNMAKKQTKEMRDPNLTELIKDALKNPKRADLNKDGKLSDYEEKRGAAIEKSMDKEKVDEVELPMSIIQKLANEIKDPQGFAKAMLGIFDAIQDKEQKDYSKNQKFGRVLNFLKDIADDKDESKVTEDLDLGHEDNEPHMLKADLYRIGKYAMELYQIVDQFEDMGEVDFPSWWQSKVFKAKDALVGAKHYLDFEINEPKIDAVVDVATDVVDEDINQLGTDDDTGFQASLYTPNELGDASVGREYASGAFEENKKPIKENMNYNKWRRAFNGKNFAMKTILLEDYSNNKKRYAIRFKYNETPRADVVSVSEVHFGGHEGSGMPFSLSNMQTKPHKLFSPDDKFEWDNEEEFEKFLESGSKGLENLLSFFLGGKFADDAIEDHLETGVYKIVKIKEAEYIPSAAVNENKSSKYSTVAEKLAKELKEGLPKGFWDKKIDAKDEDQDGKIDEEQGMDPERFVGSGGDEIDSDNISNKTVDNPAQDAEIGFGLEEFAYGDGSNDPFDSGELADGDYEEDIEESYNTLVNKIKKQGKSAKAAKAIAGAVASYKAKGGGKVPTAKQK